MASTTLRIATRKSPLALWQANYVRCRLQGEHPGLKVELRPRTTEGDKLLAAPLAKIGGKGLFIKELETALLNGEADIAVHSMKDVPMALPPALALAVICPRADPRDAFVSNHYQTVAELPQAAVVGTCSLRRKAQLLAARPDLCIRNLRGNVQTRLDRLDADDYDAIILAAAGLIRLQQAERISDYINPDMSLPAAGQGAIGIEIRAGDTATLALLQALHCEQTAACVTAERTVSRHLGGSCQMPLAAYAQLNGGQLALQARVATVDGTTVLQAAGSDAAGNAEALGRAVAEQLLAQGAAAILAAIDGSDAH